jgi:hypothetical protein
VLNTLIAIKNSPDLLSDRGAIRKYLDDDIASLKIESKPTHQEFKNYLNNAIAQDSLRNLNVTVDLKIDDDLEEVVYELMGEIVRELVLNTKKHSLATECSILIESVYKPVDEVIYSTLRARQISIIFEDNSPKIVLAEGLAQVSSFKSETISRLLRPVDGTHEIELGSSELIQRIEFLVPESHQTFIEQVRTLRQESILFLSKGFILLSLVYASISLPGYIYLGLDLDISILYLAQITFLTLALKQERFALPLAAMGSIASIMIFPLFAVKPLVCSEIQYLPWIFNGLLGSAFFVTLLIKSNILKWLPIFLFLLSSLSIQYKLPTACENLLDGSIPGIILITVIAIGFIVARAKSKSAQELYISDSVKEYQDFENTKKRVRTERERVIQRLKQLADEIIEKNRKSEDILNLINQNIVFIRTFLLCSEYFNSKLAFELYCYSRDRSISGQQTSLEINTNDFPVNISELEIQRLLASLRRETEGKSIHIEIRSKSLLHITAYVLDEKGRKPVVLKSQGLRIEIVSKS